MKDIFVGENSSIWFEIPYSREVIKINVDILYLSSDVRYDWSISRAVFHSTARQIQKAILIEIFLNLSKAHQNSPDQQMISKRKESCKSLM